MNALGTVLAPLVDLVFPPRCPLCGTQTAAQGGLCSDCWQNLSIPTDPSCAACARPLPQDSSSRDALCGACLAGMPRHDGISAATIYNDTSRKLVLAFKHGKRIALAPQLARLMAAKLPAQTEHQALLVPVPLHRWRLWRRGFNQAALLAIELEKLGKGKLVVDVLQRQKATPMLGGMHRLERERTLRGAISVNPKREGVLLAQDIVLIDDVLTSGATTNACVRALKSAGARSVRIACFARVLNE